MTTTPTSGEPAAHGPDGGQDGRRGRDGRLRRVWQRRAFRLAVGVVAAAVALTAAAVALGQVVGPFQDVGNDHYARDSTQWAVQNRITFGCRDGTYFCPERTVNRAESVTFLHRYHSNMISPRLDNIEADISRLRGQPITTTTTTTTTPPPDPPPEPKTVKHVLTATRSGESERERLDAGTYKVTFRVKLPEGFSPEGAAPNGLNFGGDDDNKKTRVELRTTVNDRYSAADKRCTSVGTAIDQINNTAVSGTVRVHECVIDTTFTVGETLVDDARPGWVQFTAYLYNNRDDADGGPAPVTNVHWEIEITGTTDPY